jgi:hypothetical protein
MSTKTLRKRIALVAVSALGAGLLSVVAVPSANAAETVTGTTYNWGSAAGAAYTSSTDGFCFQNDTTDILEIRYGRWSGGVKLAVATADNGIAVTKYAYFTATGAGYFSNAAAAADGSELKVSKTADEKTITFGDSAALANKDMADEVTWVPTAAGKTTISLYEVVGATGAQTLLETYTLLANTACSGGGYASTYSGAQLQVNSTAMTTATGAADASGAVNVDYATGESYLGLWLRDAYGEAVSDTDSYLTAKATGGCTLTWAAGDLSSTRTSVVATSGITNEVLKIFSAGATANKCDVTVDYNGTTVATKSINFNGDAASVKVVAQDYAIPDTSVTAGYYDILDAAGTRLTGWAPDAVDLTGALAGAAITFGASTGSSTQGAITIDTVNNNRGVGTFRIRVENDTTYLYSPVITMQVSGGVATYGVSLDKASYGPGEIITATISAKDSKGAIVADGTALSTSGNLDFTLAGATALGSAPAHGDVAENGKWVYKYIAGTTEGDWAANVTLKNIVTDTAKQATYKIASKSTAVSNADVLKAIVSLIASINKQIAALQKALLKK